MSEGEVHLPHQSHTSITAVCAVQYPPPSLMENWFVYVCECEERSGKKCWYLKGRDFRSCQRGPVLPITKRARARGVFPRLFDVAIFMDRVAMYSWSWLDPGITLHSCRGVQIILLFQSDRL